MERHRSSTDEVLLAAVVEVCRRLHMHRAEVACCEAQSWIRSRRYSVLGVRNTGLMFDEMQISQFCCNNCKSELLEMVPKKTFFRPYSKQFLRWSLILLASKFFFFFKADDVCEAAHRHESSPCRFRRVVGCTPHRTFRSKQIHADLPGSGGERFRFFCATWKSCMAWICTGSSIEMTRSIHSLTASDEGEANVLSWQWYWACG